MRDRLSVSLKVFGSHKWGDLNAFGLTHEIVGETVSMKDQNFTFIGGHRVRLYSFKKNVHWRIPMGTELDISEVKPTPDVPAGSKKAQKRR